MQTRHWVAGFGIAALLSLSGRARAETTLVKPAEGWEVYTSGRVGAFVELLEGDGVPVTPSGVTPQV